MTTLTIILCGAVTFAVRYALFGPIGPEHLPARIRSTLPYVMPAVLMAIIVPSVLMPDGAGGDLTAVAPYLGGAVCGFAVGAFRKNAFFLVFAVSMAGFVLTKLAV
ncbi:AzlD domain-containing protein [Kitasatospora sp. NPDC097643]|uniref:AzlD domain-containing protein n=1 Tax=Kitasatospora sp. NPDC097643 TaxID=3157230 RepID=UPI003324E80C